MLLAELHAAPAYVRAEEYDEQQASTPASFKDMAPKLVTEVADVLVKLDPVPAWLATDSDGTGCLRGHLWLTEESASFLAEGEVPAGFQLPYSSIALHAVSRAVPEDMLAMEKDTTYAKDVCIYCQLDDHPERDDGQDEDEEPSILELWIVVPDSGTCTSVDLTQWTSSLTRCRSVRRCTPRLPTATMPAGIRLPASRRLGPARLRTPIRIRAKG